jgi:hypothetical membrane protein
MGIIHEVFSVFFFILAPVSMILVGTVIFRSSNKPLGFVTIILGIVGLYPLFVTWPWKGDAIPDMISITDIMYFL